MTITIEHSGDGTLVHGTTRGDTAAVNALKANGFRWSRNLDAWYLNRSWSIWTREAKVKAVVSILGDQVTVDRGEAAKSSTAEERVAARLDRATQRAEYQEARSDALTAESDAQWARSHAITEHIPFGQPVLVGHYSERRHRNALDRSWNLLGKSVQTQREADHLAQRAAGNDRLVSTYDDPVKIGRRLDRNRAEERKLTRQIDGTGKAIHGEDIPHPTEYRLARQLELRQDIARDEQALEAQGVTIWSKATVKAGDVVRIRGYWSPVVKANPKTVEVRVDNRGWTLKYPYSEIRDRRDAPQEASS